MEDGRWRIDKTVRVKGASGVRGRPSCLEERGEDGGWKVEDRQESSCDGHFRGSRAGSCWTEISVALQHPTSPTQQTTATAPLLIASFLARHFPSHSPSRATPHRTLPHAPLPIASFPTHHFPSHTPHGTSHRTSPAPHPPFSIFHPLSSILYLPSSIFHPLSSILYLPSSPPFPPPHYIRMPARRASPTASSHSPVINQGPAPLIPTRIRFRG